MSDNDQVLRRLAVEIQILQETAKTLQNRIGTVGSALAEVQTTNFTLEGLRKEQKGKPILVPIGGGSYIKANITDSKKVIFGIGANVATEKTIDEAQEGVSQRIINLQKIITELQNQLRQVITKINENQDRIRTLTQPIRRQDSV